MDIIVFWKKALTFLSLGNPKQMLPGSFQNCCQNYCITFHSQSLSSSPVWPCSTAGLAWGHFSPSLSPALIMERGKVRCFTPNTRVLPHSGKAQIAWHGHKPAQTISLLLTHTHKDTEKSLTIFHNLSLIVLGCLRTLWHAIQGCCPSNVRTNWYCPRNVQQIPWRLHVCCQ